MSRASELRALPDSHECYVPGVGLVAIGEVRWARPEETPALADPLAGTLAMWEHIVMNPRCTPEEWRKTHGSGRTRPANEAHPE